jgi:hypothetical protein
MMGKSFHSPADKPGSSARSSPKSSPASPPPMCDFCAGTLAGDGAVLVLTEEGELQYELIKANGLAVLVQLLYRKDAAVVCSALAALHQVVLHSPRDGKEVVDEDIMPAIRMLVDDYKLATGAEERTVMSSALQLLASLCKAKYNPDLKIHLANHGAIDILVDIVSWILHDEPAEDTSSRSDSSLVASSVKDVMLLYAAMGLKHLSDLMLLLPTAAGSQTALIMASQQSNCAEGDATGGMSGTEKRLASAVVQLCLSSASTVALQHGAEALEIICSACSQRRSDQATTDFVKLGGLGALMRLASSDDVTIVRYAACSIAVVSGYLDHQAALLADGLIETMRRIVLLHDPGVLKAAATVLADLSNNSNNHRELVTNGGLRLAKYLCVECVTDPAILRQVAQVFSALSADPAHHEAILCERGLDLLCTLSNAEKSDPTKRTCPLWIANTFERISRGDRVEELKAAVPKLIHLLESDDACVRSSATRALRRLHTEGAFLSPRASTPATPAPSVVPSPSPLVGKMRIKCNYGAKRAILELDVGCSLEVLQRKLFDTYNENCFIMYDDNENNRLTITREEHLRQAMTSHIDNPDSCDSLFTIYVSNKDHHKASVSSAATAEPSADAGGSQQQLAMKKASAIRCVCVCASFWHPAKRGSER